MTTAEGGRTEPLPTGRPLPIAAVEAGGAVVDRAVLTDGDRMTRWDSGSAQDGTETMTIDLGSIQRVDGVTLAIELSDDLQSWTVQWRGRCGSKAVAAAVRDPRMVPLTFGFAPASARWIRLRQLGTAPKVHWSIADLTVFGQ